MIESYINEVGNPLIALEAKGNGRKEPADFLVDTGFDGELGITQDMAKRLEVKPLGARRYTLPTGVQYSFDYCLIRVTLDGVAETLAEALVMGENLVGVGFLRRLFQKIVIDYGSLRVQFHIGPKP